MKVFTTMTSAAALLYAVPAAAQTCTVAPSCATLGYTESLVDCYGSKYVRCPFDLNKVMCITPKPAIGDLKYSWKNVDHDGWLLCNGRTITKSMYPDLYSLVGSTLPNYSGYFLKGAATTTISTFKTAQTAGLPNITGDVSLRGAEYSGSTNSSGAMSISAYSNYGSGHNSSGSSTKITFNASKSNSIYGNSTTVTPQNYSANIFIYGGATSASLLDCKGSNPDTATNEDSKEFGTGYCYGEYYDKCGVSKTTYTSSELGPACSSFAGQVIKTCVLDSDCMDHEYNISISTDTDDSDSSACSSSCYANCMANSGVNDGQTCQADCASGNCW